MSNSIQQMPASAAGSAVMMMKASTQDWKFTTIKQIHHHDRHHQADAQLDEGGSHGLAWPRISTLTPRGRCGRNSATKRRMSREMLPMSRPCALE